jgi:hypothetical protein
MNIKKLVLIASVFAIAHKSIAQTSPEIVSWIRNTTGATGYNNIPSNVQIVQYSVNNVYVSCTCIPSYNIGPWPGNPNTPTNQNFVYKITRNPQQNTGTPTNVGLGHIGVWINGVSIFNVSDGMSYNNQGIWNRNAYFWEGASFDSCLGHPAPNGEYHHHVSPNCLYDNTDSLNHSPIIGYAFDGFPVYGAYGFTNTNGTGPIKRMASSYVLSTATTRVNGPPVNATYPLGCFMEDYSYSAGSGDLDNRNGRFCVTPEYPGGIYAYFTTLDAQLLPVFPYTFYQTYYGTVQAGNIGPNSGHNTISEPVIVYTSINEIENKIEFSVYPNPANDDIYFFLPPSYNSNMTAVLYDESGKEVMEMENIQTSITYSFKSDHLSNGLYSLVIQSGSAKSTSKIMVNH